MIKTGDKMKKFIPYIFSIIIGIIFGFLLFNSREDISNVFNESINATGFQLGVFNSLDMAKDYTKKFPSAIIIQDGNLYRVYYSILTEKNTISKMSKILEESKISYYQKNITINDKGLIKALYDYESSMNEGNDNTFLSINKMIMECYGGKIWD